MTFAGKTQQDENPDIRVSLGCTAVIITIAAATPMSLFAIFGNKAGAPVTDIVWLMMGQGAFLAATLFPLEIAREHL